MFEVVRDEVFFFIKILGGILENNVYFRYMKDVVFMIGSLVLLVNVV